jgi:hypothetical protein
VTRDNRYKHPLYVFEVGPDSFVAVDTRTGRVFTI